MSKYELLLPTDGSDCAHKAEIAAMNIAKSYNIRMAVIYVAVAKKDSEREELIAHGEEVLKRVVETGADMGIEIHKILVGEAYSRYRKKEHALKSLLIRSWKLPRNLGFIRSLWVV